MVVPVQEGRIGGDALGFAGIRAGVGPFLERGAVEPLDLAVGLRPIRPGPLVRDRVAEGGGEQLRAVGRAVVGQHPGHGDAAVGEPGPRRAQNATTVCWRSSGRISEEASREWSSSTWCRYA